MAARRTAADDGSQPCYQLRWIERLCNIIVGAGFQSQNSVDIAALGAQHDDWHEVGLPHASEQFNSVSVWKHNVEYDGVETSPRCSLNSIHSSSRDIALEAL